MPPAVFGRRDLRPGAAVRGPSICWQPTPAATSSRSVTTGRSYCRWRSCGRTFGCCRSPSCRGPGPPGRPRADRRGAFVRQRRPRRLIASSQDPRAMRPTAAPGSTCCRACVPTARWSRLGPDDSGRGRPCCRPTRSCATAPRAMAAPPISDVAALLDSHGDVRRPRRGRPGDRPERRADARRRRRPRDLLWSVFASGPRGATVHVANMTANQQAGDRRPGGGAGVVARRSAVRQRRVGRWPVLPSGAYLIGYREAEPADIDDLVAIVLAAMDTCRDWRPRAGGRPTRPPRRPLAPPVRRPDARQPRADGRRPRAVGRPGRRARLQPGARRRYQRCLRSATSGCCS